MTKFSSLIANRHTLSDDELKILKDLKPTYNKLNPNIRDEFTIAELREIKKLRSEYSSKRARVLDKKKRLEQANESLGNNRFTFLSGIFPDATELDVIDKRAEVFSIPKDVYLESLRNANDSLTDFLANKNNSSVKLKQFIRNKPSNQLKGTVDWMMKNLGIAAFNIDDLDAFIEAFETIRELSDRAGVKGSNIINFVADNEIDIKKLGRDLLEDSTRTKTVKMIYDLING